MNNESQTPRTDNFLDALPAGLPAEEKLDQLSAHARDQERVLARTLGQLAKMLEDAGEVQDLRRLCADTACAIQDGGGLGEVTETLWEAARLDLAGDERTEDELLDEAAEIVRAWRVLKQYGTGDKEALRERRKAFDADCDASGLSSLELMERGEKKLDRDNAARILGQQH